MRARVVGFGLLYWTFSSSALLRALIRHAAAQGADWCREARFALIEEESKPGRPWGST